MQGGILTFNRISYENAGSHGIGVLVLIDELSPEAKANEAPAVFASLKRTGLTGTITGPIASLCLRQTYSFTEKQCTKVIEARYRFPLPGDAAVTGVTVRFGDVEMTTVLKDRNEARQEYKEAKREGRQAIMVSRESPDVFTICIAGIRPGEDIVVDTRYVQLATAEGPGWSLRIPLTTAPRYARKDETSSRHAQGQPLAVLRDPGHTFSMDLTLRGASAIESPTHRISVNLEGESLRLRLQGGEVIPDRDCILLWKPERVQDRPALHVLLQEDEPAKEAFFLALVAPPASGDVKKVPGEYVLLVDHSGSMDGSKRAAADRAVEKFLLGLDREDWFTVGVFHDNVKWFSRSLQTACVENVQRAIGFLRGLTESGGTRLGVALEQALQFQKSGLEASRHVLVITDAEVTDEGRLLRLAAEESRRRDRRRISLLCIDSAPNAFLAQELASRGGGIAKFLTSAPEEGDIATALVSILESWSKTIYADLRIFVNRNVAAVGGEVCDIGNGSCFIDLGDMRAGQAVWAAGKIAGKVPEEGKPVSEALSFCLMTREGRRFEPVMPDTVGQIEGQSGIRPLYCARQILGLEFLIHSRYAGKELQDELRRLGYDPDQVLYRNKVSSLYPENSKVNETEALREFIVAESLRYGVPSSETAFIAVYHKAGKPVEATTLVPNALADGWSEGFENKCYSYGGPAGAGVSDLPGRKSRKLRQNPSSGIIEEIDDVNQDQFIVADCTRRSAPASDISASRYRRPSNRRVCSIIDIVDGCGGSGGSASPPAREKSTPPGESVIFAGVPQFTGNESVLFDSGAKGDAGGFAGLIYRIKLRYPDGAPASVENGLCIRLFVGDMLTPAATVKLADLLQHAGILPLNIPVEKGRQVKVVLSDPAGAWAKGALRIIVSLGQRPAG